MILLWRKICCKLIDLFFLLLCLNMAQRTEKEETEFKVVPETITLCVNNCGVLGNPATNNMCQKCFNATTATSSSGSSAAGNIIFGEKSPRSSSSNRSSPARAVDRAEASRDLKKVEFTAKVGGLKTIVTEQTVMAKREVNRCSGCRRKVGLTGFRCRCGELFCWEHRYSDRHDCSYDYKAAGREAIARENPVVKAAKIVKV